jgi:hypothetical protein
MRLRNATLLWRPDGTRASYLARAVLVLGLIALVAGFIYAIHNPSPRWAKPLLWTGYALTMVAALAVGLTARPFPSPSEERKRAKRRDRHT